MYKFKMEGHRTSIMMQHTHMDVTAIYIYIYIPTPIIDRKVGTSTRNGEPMGIFYFEAP